MYRSAAKRLPNFPSTCFNWRPHIPQARARAINPPRFCTSATWDPLSGNNPNQFEPTSSSSSSSWAEEERARSHEKQSKRSRPNAHCHYEDEQAKVLNASLRHVIRLGWSEAAMFAGAREAGLSPSIVGSFPQKEAALIEFFMDECLQRLIDIIDSGEEVKDLVPSERIAKLVKIRLEMQAPYISKWPQALSIQALPSNVPTSFKQRAALVDEIWHAAGDESSDVDWYVKRSLLGSIYSLAEVYMLTDNSPDFRDTWAFLDGRVKDAFDLKKTIQEVKYLAEAVGGGIGSSFEGFMKRAFQK
ncbi:hypothetical protein RJ639_025777 [Escallonia herrerae]|uniref:Ubiquinone biosynthesis protein n=1 Tax=Escallonia herrerae TaxID=1293975 RepID=A0AA88S3U8_9ASTE|nr:hypothetical protein RJ639_025777 [Escallonia herrerae]